MKSSLLAAGMVAWASFAPAFAQANATNSGSPSGGDDRRQRMIGFLPKADQDRVVAAYDKAVADNPDLKTQQEELRQQHESLESGSKEEMRAFMEKARAYQQKLRQAMLKEDATLGPILDQIDQHRTEMRAQHQESMGDGSGQ